MSRDVFLFKLGYFLACGWKKLNNYFSMNDALRPLVDGLLESYTKTGIINNVDGANLPSKAVVGEITSDLLRLLLPGFFEGYPVEMQSLRYKTQTLASSVSARLEEEIFKSLDFYAAEEYQCMNLERASSEIVNYFLAHFTVIRDLLETDAEAAFEGDPAARSQEEVIVAYPFIEAIAVQRMAHILYRMNVGVIPRLMTEWAHSRTGIDIHPGAQIGTHFFIDHGTGTVVGETCRIGNHVKMYHGVTLGAKSTAAGQKLRGQIRHPTIYDYVTIYPGATILGGDTVIGERSTIGGNVYLIESVPAHSLVVQEGVSVKVLDKKRHTKSIFLG